MTPAALLLLGHVEQAANAEAPTPTDQVHRIRALVALGWLDQAATLLERIPADTPLRPLAEALLALAQGRPARARLLLEGPEPDGLEARLLTAITRAELARAAGDAARAVQHGGRALELAEQAEESWGPWAGLALGRALAAAGDLRTARGVLEQAVRGFRAHQDGTVALAEGLDALAHVRRLQGEPAAGVALHTEALALWQQLPADTVPVSTARFQLAQALHRAGDVEGALEAMQHAFLATVRALGTDHLDTWTTRFELGRLEVEAGDPFAGLPRMEAALTEVEARLGPQHPVVRGMRRILP